MLVAHFTDVHVFSIGGAHLWQMASKRLAGSANFVLRRRGAHPVENFARLVEDVAAQRPDHVVVSGDLTSLSLPDEYRQARVLLDGLGLGPRGVSVVPGNHDVYVWEAWLADYFGRHLGCFATSDDGGRGFPFVRRRGELSVIGANTALPSPVPLADGWLGRRQIAAIDAALAAEAGRFRILALHHPPVDNRQAFLRALRDRSRLQTVLARRGAEFVLCGHEHRDSVLELPGPAGPIPVVTVGSGTYRDPRPDRRARYNLYRVERRGDGWKVTLTTRVLDERGERFSDLSTREL